MLVSRVAQAKKSRIGRALDKFASQIGGPSAAAGLNLMCTAALGIIITWPIYEVGGFYAAIPTGGFTLILLSIISLAIIVNVTSSDALRKVTRPLLVFAIMFSLPFGLLSLSLLHSISQPHQHNK